MLEPLVQLLEVELLGNNPSAYESPFQWRMRLEAQDTMSEPITVSFVWVGSASSSRFDQILDSFDVGPLERGVTECRFECDAPRLDLVPCDDVLGVTILVISFQYRAQEFLRVGYYTQVAYFDAHLNLFPPRVPQADLIGRFVAMPQPAVTGQREMSAYAYSLSHARDDHRWRRAASMPVEAGMTPTRVARDALWALYHRGNAVNASSMRFASALRSSMLLHGRQCQSDTCSDRRDGSDGRSCSCRNRDGSNDSSSKRQKQRQRQECEACDGSHVLRETCRPRWNASKRCCTRPDMLTRLWLDRLSRQSSAAHTTVTMAATAVDGSASRATRRRAASTCVRGTGKDDAVCTRAPQYGYWMARQLVCIETAQRRQLMQHERHTRTRLCSDAIQQLLLVHGSSEARERRDIVAVYMRTLQSLRAAWHRVIRRVTGLTASTYTQLCAAQADEVARRVRLVDAEAVARERLLRVGYAQQLQLTERAIAQCKRAELACYRETQWR